MELERPCGLELQIQIAVFRRAGRKRAHKNGNRLRLGTFSRIPVCETAHGFTTHIHTYNTYTHISVLFLQVARTYAGESHPFAQIDSLYEADESAGWCGVCNQVREHTHTWHTYTTRGIQLLHQRRWQVGHSHQNRCLLHQNHHQKLLLLQEVLHRKR